VQLILVNVPRGQTEHGLQKRSPNLVREGSPSGSRGWNSVVLHPVSGEHSRSLSLRHADEENVPGWHSVHFLHEEPSR
jgi:hypothetical protein